MCFGDKNRYSVTHAWSVRKRKPTIFRKIIAKKKNCTRSTMAWKHRRPHMAIVFLGYFVLRLMDAVYPCFLRTIYRRIYRRHILCRPCIPYKKRPVFIEFICIIIRFFFEIKVYWIIKEINSFFGLTSFTKVFFIYNYNK